MDESQNPLQMGLVARVDFLIGKIVRKNYITDMERDLMNGTITKLNNFQDSLNLLDDNIKYLNELVL